MSVLSPSFKALRPRWLVPVSLTPPHSKSWVELTHSMIRGILWARSLVLQFCFRSSLTHNRTRNSWGTSISSAVTNRGPWGEGGPGLQLVKGVAAGGQSPGETLDEVQVAADVVKGFLLALVASWLDNEQGQRCFAFEDGGRNVG